MTTLKTHRQANNPSTKANSNPGVIYLLWIIVTMTGWWAGVFDLESEAKTYMDIVRLMPLYLADGLLIGFIVGVGQAILLRRFTGLSGPWIWATILGYGLAFLTGLMVTVSIPSIITLLRDGHLLLPFTEPSTIDIFLNLDDLFWGGFLIGMFQWPILKKVIPSPTRSKAFLWVLANWLVLGASVFVRAFTHQSALASLQMACMGASMGVVTGAVLLIFLSNLDLVEP